MTRPIGQRLRLASSVRADRWDLPPGNRGQTTFFVPRRNRGLPPITSRKNRGLTPIIAAVVLLLAAIGAYAAEGGGAATQPADPALEAQVQRVAAQLRCLVCQNQTIADSNAELAQDLRREVRAMLARGESEEDVRDFMVARYGDFILYRPPLKATTLLLWVGPFVLLAAGIWGLRRIAVERRRVVGAASASLSAEEQARLQALVDGQESG